MTRCGTRGIRLFDHVNIFELFLGVLWGFFAGIPLLKRGKIPIRVIGKFRRRIGMILVASERMIVGRVTLIGGGMSGKEGIPIAVCHI